jgi:hypothetical protein
VINQIDKNMKLVISIIFFLTTFQLNAQELFTWSEPASNMAAKGFGFRVTNTFMKEVSSDKYHYRLVPEVMWGASSKIMVHVEGFFNNGINGFSVDGGALYLKYRFLSQDEVHSHFRMAFYARASINDSHIHQAGIDLNGLNSGYEAGLIATKLINKVAISASGGFLHATDNTSGNKVYYEDDDRNALAYNFSIGKLMLPKEYKDYNQTNLNLMLELPGQTNIGSGKTYLDLAPVAQLIILSRIRIDASYRFAMVKDLYRTAPTGFLIRLEYNIFNVY